MISKTDAKRIATDAEIAIDALTSLTYCVRTGGELHENYLREKVRCAQSCLDFMKSFYEENANE